MSNVAVVTGANKGLGWEIVKGLCEKYNGKVYLTARDEKRGQEACDKLIRLGHNPIYYQLDVTNDGSITRFVKHIRDEGEEVEILVNNAGLLFLKDAMEPKLYQVEETLKVNFFSLVNFTEAVLPLVKNGGRIVNITSSSGHLSRIPSAILRQKLSSYLTLKELKDLMNTYIDAVKRDAEVADDWGQSPYVVSKVGVNAYTFMLHRKLSSRDIKVNCVHPGYVISDMTKGVGSVTPAQAVGNTLRLALEPEGGGLYVWHSGAAVPWDGPDPRVYIDAMKL